MANKFDNLFDSRTFVENLRKQVPNILLYKNRRSKSILDWYLKNLIKLKTIYLLNYENATQESARTRFRST